MGHVAAQRLRWGDRWIEPGERVPEDEPGRNYALMVECGQIETAGHAGSARNPVAVAGDLRTGTSDRRPARRSAAASDQGAGDGNEPTKAKPAARKPRARKSR